MLTRGKAPNTLKMSLTSCPPGCPPVTHHPPRPPPPAVLYRSYVIQTTPLEFDTLSEDGAGATVDARVYGDDDPGRGATVAAGCISGSFFAGSGGITPR